MPKALNVLIVDDSIDDRELYTRILRRDGDRSYNIVEAEDGQSGLKVFSETNIDCVLLDYSLPGQNSLEVLKQFTAVEPLAPVIFFTGQGSEALAAEAMKSGACDYISKNDINSDRLIKAIVSTIERIEMLRKIQERQEAQNAFAKILAHDFKEPLSTILGMNGLIEDVVKTGDYEDIPELTSRIKRSATRMGDLIAALRLYNSASDFKEPVNAVCLSGVVSDALNNLTCTVEQRGAEVQVGELPTVSGATPLLVLVFQNIIANAIKFCASEKPTVRIWAESMGPKWVCYIRDNGIGISAQYHQTIFKPSCRLHNNDEFAGSGLGLATCKTIIESHGGKIWCESEEGAGSTFVLSLPKSREDNKIATPPPVSAPIPLAAAE